MLGSRLLPEIVCFKDTIYLVFPLSSVEYGVLYGKWESDKAQQDADKEGRARQWRVERVVHSAQPSIDAVLCREGVETRYTMHGKSVNREMAERL
jgi:hypothetical protein